LPTASPSFPRLAVHIGSPDFITATGMFIAAGELAAHFAEDALDGDD